MEEMAKVTDYPGLMKGSGYVVNKNKDDYQRALARLKSGREQAALRRKVDALEHKMDLILKALGIQDGNQQA